MPGGAFVGMVLQATEPSGSPRSCAMRVSTYTADWHCSVAIAMSRCAPGIVAGLADRRLSVHAIWRNLEGPRWIKARYYESVNSHCR